LVTVGDLAFASRPNLSKGHGGADGRPGQDQQGGESLEQRRADIVLVRAFITAQERGQ
jgi:hypothetical protein